MTNEEIKELINRRRRQVLVHSTIYYEYNQNLVPDSTWAKWAVELEDLQKKYPDIAKECIFADGFKNFEHSSGYNLPTRDPWATSMATRLLEYSRKRHSPL